MYAVLRCEFAYFVYMIRHRKGTGFILVVLQVRLVIS